MREIERLKPIMNYREGNVRNATLRKIPITPGTVLHETYPGNEGVVIRKACNYFELSTGPKDHVVMTDLPGERWSHEQILKDFFGRILIGGLGMGLFFNYIEDYESIDVVEIDKDVIDLIWPYYADKPNVNIIHSDLMDFQPSGFYDCLYDDFTNPGPYWKRAPESQRLRVIYKFNLQVGYIRFWEWEVSD